MSSGSSGSDETISAAKIDPLASDQKAGVPHDTSSGGVIGTDEIIDQSRIDPLGGKDGLMRPLGAPPSEPQVDYLYGAFQTQREVILISSGSGLASTLCQYQHTEPHADSQGVVGRDETIQGAKIEPLEGGPHQATSNEPGLDDEQVDASRINPMGVVREEMS